MSTCRWLLFVVLMTAGLSAQPAIEFTGVLAAGSETKVALVDKSTGASRWVKLGQEFAGYVVKNYEAGGEVVVLTKGGAQFRLTLKSSSKVKAGSSADPSPEIKRAILNNLRQLAAAADQYYLENGKSTTTLAEIVGPTKYVKQLNVVDGENYGQLIFAQGKPLVVTTAGGYTTTYNP